MIPVLDEHVLFIITADLVNEFVKLTKNHCRAKWK